jgi:hypothetical protein
MVQILALMSSKNECEVELARLRGVLNANQAGMGPAHANPMGAQSCAVLEAALVLYDKALAPLLTMQNAWAPPPPQQQLQSSSVSAIGSIFLSGSGFPGQPRDGQMGPMYHPWPQSAHVSMIDGIHGDLSVPKLPPGQHGPIRAVYMAHINEDHDVARFVIPPSLLAQFTPDRLDEMLFDESWRNAFG